jgi:hypothetical protein
MKYIFTAAIIILLASCNYDLEFMGEQDDLYVIEQGQHNSINSFKGFEGNTLSFEAKFNESAYYTTKSPSNQADINKLLGFSDCGVDHHENSARFGWRWYNDRLEILAYVYNNGNRIMEYITSVPQDEFIFYEISKTSNGYRFRVADTVTDIPADFNNCTEGANYYLWPYFGGNETAPQDISIMIQQVKEHYPETIN